MTTINKKTSEVLISVNEWVKSEILTFPFTVESSPDDPFTIYIRVFGVPDGQITSIENIIIDLENRLPNDTNFMLLPMVKNLKTTQEYYPEHMPEPSMSFDQI